MNNIPLLYQKGHPRQVHNSRSHQEDQARALPPIQIQGRPQLPKAPVKNSHKASLKQEFDEQIKYHCKRRPTKFTHAK